MRKYIFYISVYFFSFLSSYAQNGISFENDTIPRADYPITYRDSIRGEIDKITAEISTLTFIKDSLSKKILLIESKRDTALYRIGQTKKEYNAYVDIQKKRNIKDSMFNDTIEKIHLSILNNKDRLLEGNKSQRKAAKLQIPILKDSLDKQKIKLSVFESEHRIVKVKKDSVLKAYIKLQEGYEKLHFEEKITHLLSEKEKIERKINGFHQGLNYQNAILESQDKEIKQVKDYIFLHLDESYYLFAKDIKKELIPIIRSRSEKIVESNKLLLEKDMFEKTQVYNARVSKGRSILGEAQLIYESALSELEKKYQELEYKKIIAPLIEKSRKTFPISNVNLEDYDADTEDFIITFECCGGEIIKGRGKANPKLAKIMFLSLDKIKGTVIQVLASDGQSNEYYGGELYLPSIGEEIIRFTGY